MNQAGGAKAWIIGLLAAMGLGLGALVGVGCAIGANSCPFIKDKQPTATTGREIWVQNCALCHGVNGAGAPQNRRAPSLVSGGSADLTFEQIRAKTERGAVGLMPRFEGKLTPAQIDAVARYVIELREAS